MILPYAWLIGDWQQIGTLARWSDPKAISCTIGAVEINTSVSCYASRQFEKDEQVPLLNRFRFHLEPRTTQGGDLTWLDGSLLALRLCFRTQKYISDLIFLFHVTLFIFFIALSTRLPAAIKASTSLELSPPVRLSLLLIFPPMQIQIALFSGIILYFFFLNKFTLHILTTKTIYIPGFNQKFSKEFFSRLYFS